jgi:hypothetical protein
MSERSAHAELLERRSHYAKYIDASLQRRIACLHPINGPTGAP